MIDMELERKLADCRALLQLWTRFNEFFEAAVRGEALSPENEKKFLELKSRIAMLHDTFLESVPDERGQAAVAQNMLENVVRSITLKHINRMPPADVKKIQIEWHESYLLLTEIIGQLEEEKLAKDKVSGTQYQMQRVKKHMSKGAGDIFKSGKIQVGVVLIIVLGLLIVPPFIGFNYWVKLKVIGKPYFLVLDLVRIVAPIGWEDIQEAKQFGAVGEAVPTVVFPDYVAGTPAQGDPISADMAIQFLARNAGVAPESIPFRGTLLGAPEYRFEKWNFGAGGGETLYVMMVRFGKTSLAQQAVMEVQGWKSSLPPASQNVADFVNAVNDYNVLLLLYSTNSGTLTAYPAQIWKIK